MINETELKTIETELLQGKSLVRYQQADLVRVHIDRDLPVVRRVWRDGVRVY